MAANHSGSVSSSRYQMIDSDSGGNAMFDDAPTDTPSTTTKGAISKVPMIQKYSVLMACACV